MHLPSLHRRGWPSDGIARRGPRDRSAGLRDMARANLSPEEKQANERAQAMGFDRSPRSPDKRRQGATIEAECTSSQEPLEQTRPSAGPQDDRAERDEDLWADLAVARQGRVQQVFVGLTLVEARSRSIHQVDRALDTMLFG